MGFLLFVFILVLMNARVWWKFRCAWCKGNGSIVLGIFMLLLLFMPAFLRVICGRGASPRVLVQISWIWLAWSFWFFSIFLLVDCWNVLLWLISYIPKCNGALGWFASDRIACWIAIGGVALGAIWGTIEANCIQVRRVELTTPYLPDNLQEYRIVQISDVHLGPAASWRRLRKTIRLIEECRPDLLVSTGDLIDGATKREEKMVEALAAMPAAQGKRYAVIGNHDVYSGIPFSRQMHERAGFQLLDNKGVLAEPWLWVYGEPDPASRQRMVEHIPEAPSGCFSLFLRHRPVYGGGHLQLSGHSHGGQIFPFNFFVRMQHPFKESVLHRLPEGALYVSRGTGVWGPPYRVMASPEITLFVLKRDAAK